MVHRARARQAETCAAQRALPDAVGALQGLLPRKPATARCLNADERVWLQNRQDTLDAKAHARDARAGKWWVRAAPRPVRTPAKGARILQAPYAR